MKFFLFSFSFFVLSACSNQAPKVHKANNFNWSRDSIKNYYLQHIASYEFLNAQNPDSLWFFNIFSKHVLNIQHAKNGGDPLLFSFDEPYSDTTDIDPNKNWLRISVNPCFYKPYCMTIEKVDNTTILRLKTSNGRGCQNLGYLDFVNETTIQQSQFFDTLATQLENLHIWNWPLNVRCRSCTDGESWTIEFIKNGRYTIHLTDSPFYNKHPKDSVLSVLVANIRDAMKFHQYMSLKTGLSITDIHQQYPNTLLHP